jgi:hypothetical protein
MRAAEIRKSIVDEVELVEKKVVTNAAKDFHQKKRQKVSFFGDFFFLAQIQPTNSQCSF